eukprot:Skav229524  [mRNA]  locus=scaffold887:130945:132089:+ [translate_table: standard]
MMLDQLESQEALRTAINSRSPGARRNPTEPDPGLHGVSRSEVAKAEALVKSLTRSPTRSLAVGALTKRNAELTALGSLHEMVVLSRSSHGLGK